MSCGIPGWNLMSANSIPYGHTGVNTVRRDQLNSRSIARLQTILDNNRADLNLNPMCEPQLGKRGLYRMIGGPKDVGVEELPLLWVLNLSDGEHSLLDVSEQSGLDFERLKRAADALVQNGLLTVLGD